MTSAPRPNEAASSRATPIRPWLRVLVAVALVFLVLVFVLSSLGPQISEALVFGWMGFLSRTLPRITWNLDLVGMALLCLAGLLGMAHGFLRWLSAQIAAARGIAWSWPWRWTWCGVAAVAIVFLVGMAVGGIAHQVGWMASSPERWYEPRTGIGRIWSDLRQLRVVLTTAAREANGDLEQTRRELRRPGNQLLTRWPNEPPWAEEYRCLFIVAGSQISGTILFPRDPSRNPEAARVHYAFGGKEDFVEMKDLPRLLRQHEGHLVAW